MDGLLWYKDAGRHSCDDFSMAVVQANNPLEDASQVEAGPFVAEGSAAGPYAGVYDGHGGPAETARFLVDSFVQRLEEFELLQTVSADVVGLKTAASAYENFVSKHGLIQPRTVSDDVVIIRKTDDIFAQEAYRDLVREKWASVDLCFLVDFFEEGVSYMPFDSDSRVRTPPKISRRDLHAERRQDVAHKTMSTRLNRKTEKRDTRLNRKNREAVRCCRARLEGQT